MYMKVKHISNCAVFILILLTFLILGLVHPDQSISESERRLLAQFPSFKTEHVISGKFMKEFGQYVADQFPYREQFRSLKALVHYNVFRQAENNGIYLVEDTVSRLEYPLKEDSVIRFAERINRIFEMYLKDNPNVFYTVVPDKNYFLAEANGFPAMDYDALLNLLKQDLPSSMTYIDIFDTLSIDKYYRTDTHWKNEQLKDTVTRIAIQMGFQDRLSYDYNIQTLTEAFQGVYYGQAALPLKPDTIKYIDNDTIRAAVVTDLDKNITGGVYYKEYQKELDTYAFFLNGSSSLITVDNPHASVNKELILFRDSFGSAIAPWLIEAYSKITIVDIRYILPETLRNLISFKDADVLFLYSTAVINNSETLK